MCGTSHVSYSFCLLLMHFSSVNLMLDRLKMNWVYLLFLGRPFVVRQLVVMIHVYLNGGAGWQNLVNTFCAEFTLIWHGDLIVITGLVSFHKIVFFFFSFFTISVVDIFCEKRKKKLGLNNLSIGTYVDGYEVEFFLFFLLRCMCWHSILRWG